VECSIKDSARLKVVEKNWRKCFHYGPNSPNTDTKADPSSNRKLVIPDKNERLVLRQRRARILISWCLNLCGNSLGSGFLFLTYRLKFCIVFILLLHNFTSMVGGFYNLLKFFVGRTIGSVLQPFSYTSLVLIGVWRRLGYLCATFPGSLNYLLLMKIPLRLIGIFSWRSSLVPVIVPHFGWEKIRNRSSLFIGQKRIMGSLYPLPSWRPASLRTRIKKLSEICANLFSRAGFLSIANLF
jgi:hypothetical protein